MYEEAWYEPLRVCRKKEIEIEVFKIVKIERARNGFRVACMKRRYTYEPELLPKVGADG